MLSIIFTLIIINIIECLIMLSYKKYDKKKLNSEKDTQWEIKIQ